MRVAILGCGAMGTVLGAYMTKNGCNVELIDSYEAHVQALNEKGAHIVGTVDFTVPVKAITPGQMEGIYDVVFLFTKQTANDEVLPNLLPHLGPDSTVWQQLRQQPFLDWNVKCLWERKIPTDRR